MFCNYLAHPYRLSWNPTRNRPRCSVCPGRCAISRIRATGRRWPWTCPSSPPNACHRRPGPSTRTAARQPFQPRKCPSANNSQHNRKSVLDTLTFISVSHFVRNHRTRNDSREVLGWSATLVWRSRPDVGRNRATQVGCLVRNF